MSAFGKRTWDSRHSYPEQKVSASGPDTAVHGLQTDRLVPPEADIPSSGSRNEHAHNRCLVEKRNIAARSESSIEDALRWASRKLGDFAKQRRREQSNIGKVASA